MNDPNTGKNGINLHAHLQELLTSIGLSLSDTGGQISFLGEDPILDSIARIGSIGALALAARNAAIATIWRMQTGRGQDLSLDLRKVIHSVSPFFSKPYVMLNGYPPGSEDPGNALGLAFYRTRDGRSVMVTNLYPGIRDKMSQLLGVANHRPAVAGAIAKWDALELEAAARERGLVAVMARTPEEWAKEPQREAIAKLPLIEIDRIGDSEPEPFIPASRPLGKIRALGMGHVIAGAEVGRSLAEYGADVLNLWEPNSVEHNTAYLHANIGMRSSTLRAASPEGNRRLKELLREADIFFENHRKERIDRLGLSPEECAQIRPGIIHVSLTCYGQTGPWANHPGFDPQALCATGYTALEGTPEEPKLPPTIVLNDFVAGWLAAAGTLAALVQRSKKGGSYRVRLNLTRTAMWFMSLGILPKGLDRSGPEHQLLEPDLYTVQTPLGEYRGIASPVQMSETPGSYNTVLVPRGSSRLEWLPR